MSSKRKRDLEVFDPNKSDSDDENFDPTEARPRKTSRRARTGSKRSGTKPRRRRGYGGSDIDEDDDVLSDSEEDVSLDEEDEEDEEAPKNAAGRRARKAATQRTNYAESDDESDDELKQEDEASEEVEAKPTKRRMVHLRVPQRASTRRTRATTEDADEFLELTNSGRHARSSKSKSPETVARTSRASRAAKSVKKAPEPIEEATQESSLREVNDADEPDELSQDQIAIESKEEIDEEMAEANDVGVEVGDVDASKEEVTPPPVAEDDEDDDDVPITRRTRAARGAAAPEAGESDAAPTGRARRLTRGRGATKRSAAEPSSDFEPGEDSEDAPMSAGGDDDELASPNPRGKASQRGRRSGRSSQHADDGSGNDDIELDEDELEEEARELRQSSKGRRRRARQESPGIVYGEKPRRKREAVNYFMPPVPPAIVEEDEVDPAPTPSRTRRARGAASAIWERNLNTTYGPFGGGGGAGSLLTGPWGTGAAGGVDSDSSDDEMMHRSNAAGNVGMTPASAAAGGLVPGGQGLADATPNVGKIKDRKALADADPLGVDMSVDFNQVGGLQGHIDQLKEMVQLPLLYPELFTRFHVTPPRGVLFHGPPGTGKTLLARALANSVGSGGKKISFYMRKGADALSKWVGEAEKQLRLLFEEARKTQPSIIFFDEIDGLAPVRSSKQEQIHASIVSTLLALMDGMDGRGQVIVIGATNRPDNIDPALRRPGRFDREFYFPLPDMDGRRAIIDIHTKDWGLSDQFKRSLAVQTKGYGGADLRALSTEAALNAIQRTYPQIYSTQEKLVVKPENISVHASDFMMAVKKLIPSSERSATSGAQALPDSIAPLLANQLDKAKAALDELLPRKKKLTALQEAMYEQHNDDDHGFGREALHQEFERSRVFRPRFIITGKHGMGHGYLASAILHYLEGVHIQNFDLPTLLGDGRPMEQVIVGLFTEVRRHKPSVIYIPNYDAWYATLRDSLAFITFQTMLRSIPPTDPVLVLATAEVEQPREMIRDFFGFSRKNHMEIAPPSPLSRRRYFSRTLEYIKKKPAEFPDPENRKKRVLEELPVAPREEPKPPTKAEIKALQKKDHQLLNSLKIQLQPIMDQINRRYKKLRQPVIPQASIEYLFAEADPHYVRADITERESRPYEIVKDKYDNDVLRDTATGKCFYNLETTTIEERLSNGFYARPQDFLFDIRALAKDAKAIGDKERTLRTNELLTNVEVDIATIETNNPHVDWDALYHRQVERARQQAEKDRKRRAMQSIVDKVQSDLGAGLSNDSDSQDAPIQSDVVPGERTMARFQVKSPPRDSSQANAEQGSTSNDTVTRVEGDVEMSGVNDDTQAASEMGPPPKSQTAMTQISQRSAVTSLPPGVSPSAVINEASTTKTSDPSTHRDSNWSTQLTNGNHSGQQPSRIDDDEEDIPDTAPPMSQATSSGEQWPHSQAQALRGDNTGMDLMLSGSPSSSNAYPRTPAKGSIGALLNDNHTEEQHLSRNSGSSASQPLDIGHSVDEFLMELTNKTSGFTIEQLEQINRDLMDEIWRSRNEWNRNKALNGATSVFNSTIGDIEEAGGMPDLSQRQNADV
ncbi:putative AAA family ATPase [Emericellopsis atlantica]|uniref:AAA family ATPase n=1 Tax=Emericellopsis atlantica TaxID=2614577 RepID=A0A9P7ZT26_9HYPO|nr:putative AAA family ATPase [Emericellopsis atlantica]KAG9257301.1 putative AAA family ATPase [Emericellopsis atlantica]